MLEEGSALGQVGPAEPGVPQQQGRLACFCKFLTAATAACIDTTTSSSPGKRSHVYFTPPSKKCKCSFFLYIFCLCFSVFCRAFVALLGPTAAPICHCDPGCSHRVPVPKATSSSPGGSCTPTHSLSLLRFEISAWGCQSPPWAGAARESLSHSGLERPLR